MIKRVTKNCAFRHKREGNWEEKPVIYSTVDLFIAFRGISNELETVFTR